MKKLVTYLVMLFCCLPLWAAHQPEFSTAGFFRMDNSGREVFSMNPAWRFYKEVWLVQKPKILMIKTGR